MKGVIVKVPATSANLGPGFDCLGIALDLWNEVIVRKADQFSISVEGYGTPNVELSEDNLVVKSTKLAFRFLNKKMPALNFHCINNIPLAKGLGSSAAATISGLLAGWALATNSLEPDLNAIFKLAADLDGHPDNAAPAIFGGVCISYTTQNIKFDKASPEYKSKFETLSHSKIEIPSTSFNCVLFMPIEELKTSESRSVIPSELPLKDAIFNISRTALLVNALSSGNNELLKIAMQDCIHQPYRSQYIKHLNRCIEAALECGACGAHLSGGGPSMIAWCPIIDDLLYNKEVIANTSKSLLKAATSCGIEGSILTTQIVQKGAYLQKLD